MLSIISIMWLDFCHCHYGMLHGSVQLAERDLRKVVSLPKHVIKVYRRALDEAVKLFEEDLEMVEPDRDALSPCEVARQAQQAGRDPNTLQSQVFRFFCLYIGASIHGGARCIQFNRNAWSSSWYECLCSIWLPTNLKHGGCFVFWCCVCRHTRCYRLCIS
jgi:hypothetical protein